MTLYFQPTFWQALDHHTAFSYWLSFLPDGPRPPNSPPLLLTCLLKDPIPRVSVSQGSCNRYRRLDPFSQNYVKPLEHM